MLKRASLRKNSLINQEPRKERSSPCCIVSENRFLTVDPFVGKPVFIAKLPSDETAGVFSRTFIVKKYIQFSDIHCRPIHASALHHWLL